MSARKETNFFLRRPNGGMPPWVDAKTEALTPRSLDEYATLFEDAGPQHKAIGESSPSYLYASVAARIAATLPDAKLIVSLRHPVEQAMSILTTWLGRKPSLSELSTWLESGRSGPRGEIPLHKHGRYAEHLTAYYARFPREQILITKFGALHRDPDGLFIQIARFVGVVPRQLLALHLNATTRPRLTLIHHLLNAKRLVRAVLPAHWLKRLTPAAHRAQSLNTSGRSCVPLGLRALLTRRYYENDIRQLEQMTRFSFTSWREDEPEMKAS